MPRPFVPTEEILDLIEKNEEKIEEILDENPFHPLSWLYERQLRWLEEFRPLDESETEMQMTEG